MRSPTPSQLAGTARRGLRSPRVQTDLLQLVKAALAAVGAWLLASRTLDLQQAFLAPYTALLTVHATVHRTVWRGAQTVLATGLGVLVAAAAVALLGSTALSLGLALLVGLGLSRAGVVRQEGTTVATTVLFVLTTGGAEEAALSDRLLATAVGVVVALVVNLVVVPPLNDRSAQQQVDGVDRALGELLQDMADQLGAPDDAGTGRSTDWVERTRSIDEDLREAWALVRHAQDSAVWNPRRRRHPDEGLDEYPWVLERLEEGVSQTRSIARHVRESTHASQEWDSVFRDRWTGLLREVGRRVADPGSDVAAVRDDLDRLAGDLSDADLPGRLWPLYGALLANLRVVVQTVDDVATARPVRT